MSMLALCTALLTALGGCPVASTPALLRAPVALSPPEGGQHTPLGAAVWPLDPTPEVLGRFTAPSSPWAAGHRGVDLRGTRGQTVRAAAAGRIAHSAVIAGRGTVSVEHPNGWRTTYEPVAGRLPVGSQVGAGTPLGRLEHAGSHCAPATCLHWGLLIAKDTYRDPLIVVGGRRPVILLPLDPD